MKLNVTHNESIHTLKDLSHHFELEAECREAQNNSSAMVARQALSQALKAKCKNYGKAP